MHVGRDGAVMRLETYNDIVSFSDRIFWIMVIKIAMICVCRFRGRLPFYRDGRLLRFGVVNLFIARIFILAGSVSLTSLLLQLLICGLRCYS
jgi:hypothetical protein